MSVRLDLIHARLCSNDRCRNEDRMADLHDLGLSGLDLRLNLIQRELSNRPKMPETWTTGVFVPMENISTVKSLDLDLYTGTLVFLLARSFVAIDRTDCVS